MVPEGFKIEDYPYNHKTVTRWTTIVDPKILETMVLLCNVVHFGQAEGTDFTTYPLSAIGHCANQQLAEDILTGEYPPILEAMMKNDPLLDQFIQRLKGRGNKST